MDTNGAGDAFVGGFIAGLAKGVTTDECVAMGNYCANTIIKRSGMMQFAPTETAKISF